MQRNVLRHGMAFATLLASLCAASLAFAAANPANGTLTEATPTLSYSGGPLVTSPNAAANNACADDPTSEGYDLTVDLPADFDTRRPNDGIKVDLGAVTSADVVLSVLDSAGTSLGDSDGGGPGGTESVSIPAIAGVHTYRVLVCVFAGSAPAYNVTIALTQSASGPGNNAYAPQFQYLLSPPAMGNGAGEPSMGYNPFSKRGMFQAGLETLRVTFPEQRTDDTLNPTGLPEACDALWEDKSFVTTSTVSLDPIGLGDFTVGRYFASQLSAKSNNMAYTDDDGENWTPSAGNFPGLAGVDHQTVGWSPYADDGISGPLTAYPNAIYYCSQDIAYANCSRSDDGGTSFLPPVQTYNTATCGGLHGHIKGAPDGTVYLPNKNCNGQQGAAVSEDNGLTWEVRKVPTSTSGETDPSLGIATDGTAYFCYTAGDGRPHVAVSHDRGVSWEHDTNLGAPVGVVGAVFAQGIAGDPDRAACGFIGTTTEGNTGAEDFEGIWYPYIAVTYDGGLTWSVTNASPGDPAQGAGGVCTSGTTCGANRNLLDFNDMVIDELGRPMLAFADGCVDACVSDPASINRSAKAAIARVAGGKSLFAANDEVTPHKPQAACLAGTRDADAVSLEWRTPAYDGESAITGYKLYRATTLDAIKASTTVLASVAPKNKYLDVSVDAAEPEYFYKIIAVNAKGDSVASNIIKLVVDTSGVGESVCINPGLTKLTDAEGDSLDGQTAHDLRKLSVAQPDPGTGPVKLYFTIKVADLNTLTAGSAYYISFNSPDGVVRGVRMQVTNPAAPTFHVYVAGTSQAGTADGRFVDSQIAADPASSYNAATGIISIVALPADLGLTTAGQKLTGFNGGVTQSSDPAGVGGPTVTEVVDEMPNGLGRQGEFEFKEATFCLPNTPPQADLKADRQQGDAPMTVNFDAGDSFDADSTDTVVQYVFDFGDGSEGVIQDTPTISHKYTTSGNYNANVKVRDSRGLASTTAASKVIEVGSVPSVGNNVLAGGLPLGSVLVLGLAGLARRRRKN